MSRATPPVLSTEIAVSHTLSRAWADPSDWVMSTQRSSRSASVRVSARARDRAPSRSTASSSHPRGTKGMSTSSSWSTLSSCCVELPSEPAARAAARSARCQCCRATFNMDRARENTPIIFSVAGDMIIFRRFLRRPLSSSSSIPRPASSRSARFAASVPSTGLQSVTDSGRHDRISTDCGDTRQYASKKDSAGDRDATVESPVGGNGASCHSVSFAPCKVARITDVFVFRAMFVKNVSRFIVCDRGGKRYTGVWWR
mmetsp:Transcript_5666/g.18403  ORF Transcript_5666/g.18403 Transcript_5666/m.18403 type:complete len:257 (+) Transcript_5666:646-1416(+)